MRENASIDPDELSLSEAAIDADLVRADMADAYEQYIQTLRDEDTRKSSEAQVYDGIYGMLRAAGRGVEVAAREAQVMTAFRPADRGGCAGSGASVQSGNRGPERLEEAGGHTLQQSGENRRGRNAPAWMNAKVVLSPV